MLKRFRKFKNQILGYAASMFVKPVSSAELDRVKLVMTLLVRNEKDIVRDNIEFHFGSGVDLIIATDNNSTDGTLEILKEYESKGVLHLIQEPSTTFNQSKWVNRMADLAVREYAANIVFHSDGDEFWMPKSGNLKTELTANPVVDVLKVVTRNIILEDLGGQERYPENATFIVKNVSKGPKIKKISNNRYLTKTHRKVMFKTPAISLYVGEGNHRVNDDEFKLVQSQSTDITIYHFPSRGKDQFYQKVIEGGESLKRTSDINSSVGGHWRKWYEAYERGELDVEYASMVLEQDAAEKLDELNVIEGNRFFPRDYISAKKST